MKEAGALPKVRKASFFESNLYKIYKRSFYQDRLGTNIGKSRKKAFSAGRPHLLQSPRLALRCALEEGASRRGEGAANGPCSWWVVGLRYVRHPDGLGVWCGEGDHYLLRSEQRVST
jgi:hypothetical protein